MNFQKRFVSFFRNFVQKVFIPQCGKNESIMNEWNKFNNLISSQNLNLNDIQLYVQSIGVYNNQINPLLMQSQQQPSSMQKKEFYYNNSSVYNRKKEESLGYENLQDINFNPNKTFGGQKTKIPVFPNKPQFDEMGRKQLNNNPSLGTKQDITKYRSTAPNNIGSMYNNNTIDNAPLMLASLQKLYKNLVENQQKIESLTQANSQVPNIGGQPYY